MLEMFRKFFEQPPAHWEQDIALSYKILRGQMRIAAQEVEKNPSPIQKLDQAAAVKTRVEILTESVFEHAGVLNRPSYIHIPFGRRAGSKEYFYLTRQKELILARAQLFNREVAPDPDNRQTVDDEDWCLAPSVVDEVARCLISLLGQKTSERIIARSQ